MPVVPFSNVPSVSPGGSTPQPFQSTNVTGDAFGAGVGRARQSAAVEVGAAQQGFAKSIEHFGDVLSKHAIDMQDRENRATATDLYTNAVLDLGKLDSEIGVLEGKARADALPKYQEGVISIQAKYRDSAPNQEVAKLFDNDFKRRMAYSIVDESKKAATAMKQANNKTYASRLSLADGQAQANSGDDQLFNIAVEDKKRAIDDLKRENKWGPEEAEDFSNKQMSELWQRRLVAMSDTDPKRAEKLLEDNRKNIKDADSIVKIEHAVNQGKIRNGSRIASDEIIKETETYKIAVNGAKPDAFWGDPDKPGFEAERISTITTKGGKSVNVNKAVASRFEGFLNELEELGYPLNDVQGYNNRNIFGTGMKSQHAFGNAIDVNPTQNPVNGGNNLPANISEIAARHGLSWGGDWTGTKKDPMHFEASAQSGTPEDRVSDTRFATMMDKAQERAKKEFPDKPGLQAQYLDTLQTRLQSDFSKLKQTVKQEQLDLRNTVNASVLSDANPTTLDQMGTDAYQAYSRMDPSQQYKVRQQLTINARRDPPLTDEALSRYMELKGLRVTDPEKFQQAWVAGEQSLPKSMRKELGNLQLNDQKKVQDTTHLTRALSVVRPMLNDAKVMSSRDDETKSKQYNEFVGAFQDALVQFQAEKKKAPSETEVMQIGAGLIRKIERPGTFFGTNESMLFEAPIPKDRSQSIETQFKSMYNRLPSPTELRTIYRRQEMRSSSSGE